MKDIFNFFEKPKDPLSFNAIRIQLASPEKVRDWSHGEVKKPRRSTTARLSLSATACSAPKSSGPSRTTSACAASTSA